MNPLRVLLIVWALAAPAMAVPAPVVQCAHAERVTCSYGTECRETAPCLNAAAATVGWMTNASPECGWNPWCYYQFPDAHRGGQYVNVLYRLCVSECLP